MSENTINSLNLDSLDLYDEHDFKNQSNHMNQSSDNIPKLRFPEFTGQWEKKKLGEITVWNSGGTPPKDNPLYWNGDIPWISASSMRGLEYGDSELKITSEGLTNGSKLAKKGTLLILVRGSMLFNKIPIGITTRDVSFNQDVKSIVVSKNSSSFYILYWFVAHEPTIMNMVTGTGIGAGKLDLQDLKALDINLPSLPEQTRIATFLTAVDTKLQSLKKKKSLLEEYKKGVMQKLFSQELRFKPALSEVEGDENGKDFPDWEEKKLGEVCDKQSSSISANKIEENCGIYPIYGAAGILKKVDFFEEENDYISIVKDGAGVGRLLYCNGKSSVLGTLDIIKPKMELNAYFLYCLLSNIDFTKYVTGSTIPHIYFKDYKNEKCGIPSLPEQTRIANFLSSIDEKINHCQKQIEQTEGWKKGLLQKMFV